MKAINNGWSFTEKWTEGFATGEGEFETVRIPHTVKELPAHYIDIKDYEMISGYRKTIHIEKQAEGKRVFIQFDGAAHIATVFCNGKELMTHRSGYTAFRCELTDYVTPGEDALIAVRLDSTENPTIPPFGYVIDYLTYGGIYRPVWLEITPETYVSDIFAEPLATDTLRVSVTLDGSEKKMNKTIRIVDAEGKTVVEERTADDQLTITYKEAIAWSDKNPYLYRCVVELENGYVKETTFGFRTIEFHNTGVLLNGKRVFMRGLNRHQCFPYVGYAATDSLQREDARILQEELGLTAVRTSHYPQSHAFIDECDRRGLLVFTEIPGWQHVGDEAWQKVACDNVREMVMQYRNHPSIVLWGVRINESQDYEKFYTETNRIAHELDSTRPTSGVRYLKKSQLLEDVYAYNDFSHTGDNAGCIPKSEATSNVHKPLLISESNGHMFPTKSFDKWSIRQSQALRHARVLNDGMADGEHVGVFQWCMFDYATHKDFGSGDRVCYHGVMDMFRNPKLAAATYASQSDSKPVLEIGSPMDIGDYPGGNIGKVYVFTNADSVKLYKNDVFVKEFKDSEFKALNHGPIYLDEYIGELLKTNEGMTGTKEKLIHKVLLSAAKKGSDNLPLADKLRLLYIMARYKMTFADGVELFGKYVGNWGGTATVWRFDGIKNGKVIASKLLSHSSKLHPEISVSSKLLHDGDTYDMAAVRIRLLDEFNNIASYAQLPVTLKATGSIDLIGPSIVTLEGGMSGTYVRTNGKEGVGTLTISIQGLEEETVNFLTEVR